MLRIGLIILLLFIFRTHLVAQEYNYTHYTIKDGLAGMIVHGSTQDKDGFIWFATETGLSRFDGQKFKNYTIADGLPSNEVFFTYTDSKNRVWIGTFVNEVCFYQNGKLYNQKNHPQLKKLHLKYRLVYVVETKEGYTGLQDAEGNLTVLDNDCNVVPVEKVRKLYHIPDSVGIEEAMTAKTFFFTPKIEAFLVNIGTGNFSRKILWGASSTGGQYIFHTIDTLVFLDTVKNTYFFKHSRDFLFARFLEKGKIFISTHSGRTYLFDVISQKNIDEFIPGNTVHFMLKDMEGNLWFSTRGNGVFKLSKFRVSCYTFGDKVPVAVHNIIRKPDGLFVATDNAHLWKMEKRKNDTLRTFPSYDKHEIPGDVTWLNNVGENFFANYYTDFLHMQFKEFSGKGGDKSIFVYKDSVLKARSGGASVFTLPDLKQIRNIHWGRATCAYRKDNAFFIGTLQGLYLYNDSCSDHLILLKDRISSFAEGENGILWISTYDKGVYGYKNGKVILNINKELNGLNSNICRCMYVTKGFLWIGTEKGLNKVSTSGKEYKVVATYSTYDGLDNDMINAIYIDSNIVYVGTQSGLNIFDESTTPRHSICNVKLTDIIVSGVHKNIGENLLLPHKDNNVRFEFSGLSFLSQGQITYKYRLLGLSDSWHTTTEQGVDYLALPSGKYTFQIKAINKFNDESRLLEQDIEVEPLLWERKWFQAGLLMITLLMIGIIFRARVRAIKQKESIKRSMNQKMLELEQMALRSQMNPHFIFNCINSIQNYIIEQDAKGANYYLSQFAGLVRQTLENASKAYLSMSEEATYIKHYIELEKLQSGDAFDYALYIDPAIDVHEVQIPNMVIQPYVENAIKHGLGQIKKGGKLLVKFTIDQDRKMLKCVIEDNGPGINARKERSSSHKPKGMFITKERINMLNQLAAKENSIELVIDDLNDISLRDSGTRVTIMFPL